MLQATNDSKDKLLLVSFTLLEFCREKMIEMCNFRWKTSHATISYSSGGGWKNKRRLSGVCRLQLKRVSFSTSNFTKEYVDYSWNVFRFQRQILPRCTRPMYQYEKTGFHLKWEPTQNIHSCGSWVWQNLTLTLYILTMVCIFLILFAIHFLRCWLGEFV